MAVGALNYTPSKTIREFMLSEAKIRAVCGPVGCLPAEAEFLSETGWVRMDSYVEGTSVAQWHPDSKEISFVRPEEYIQTPQDEPFHRFRDAYSVDMPVSSEHRVVFYDWKGSLRVETGKYIADKLKQDRTEGPRFYVPVTFRLPERRGIPLTDAQLRLMVAVHADGCFPKFYSNKGEPRCYVCVRKERKKLRLVELLNAAGVPYTERTTNSHRPTETTFIFNAPLLSKTYTEAWWGVSQRQAKIIYEEFPYWDGLQHADGEVRYASNHKSDCEFMQFICHATGHRASISRVQYPDKPAWNDTYYIQATRKLDELSTFRNCQYEELPATDGMKYCFCVPTSFFVARYNGRIFITGNSGKTSGAIVELLRQSILMPPGKDGIRQSKQLVIRNTKQQLRDTTLASVTELLPVEIYKWRESDMIMRFKFNDVECDWLFRSLDTPEDVQRVLSLQVTNAWVEEAREIPITLLSDIEGRVGRYPSQSDGFRYRSGIIYTTNPPEIDSEHYKLLEHLPQIEGEENSIIECAVFKQPSGLSPEAENIENLRPGYYEELAKGKSQAWIDVYVHGLYAKSQYGKPVYEKSFQYDRRVASGLPIDPILPVIIGMDSARKPAAVFMQLGRDGKLRKLREAVGFDMGATTFISTKLRPIIKNFFATNPLIFVGDPAWKRQNETDDNSWYKELKKQFVTNMPGSGNAVKSAATNDPSARINALDEPFRTLWPDGEPGILYDTECAMCVAGLRSKYRYTKQKTADGKFKETPDKNDWSHVVEADQYGTMFALGNHYKPSEHIRSSMHQNTESYTQHRPADRYAGY
jgi:hypothetical protein